MKTILLKITVLLIFCGIAAGLSFGQTNTFKLGFTGAYPDGNPIAYDFQKELNWNLYDELSMNIWQGWSIEGYDRHREVFERLTSHNFNAYFFPDTMILKGAYGRISVYEAESDYTDRFRYDYHHSKGTPIDDNWMGEIQHVQYYDASTPYDPPTPVLTGLYENGEQVFSGMGIPVTGQNLSWYVKPRMRIDRDVALYGPELLVARIVVTAYDGTFVDSLTITTQDFRQGDIFTYDGNYLENYYFRNMVVYADDLHRGAPPWWEGFANCHVDYQILWYGEVDLWIDYVKVMDNVANEYYGADSLIIRNYLKRLQ